MLVMIIERVPISLRGELTKWLLKPSPGVFIGQLSSMVADRLWELVQDKAKGGDGILVQSANTEQGFEVKSFGKPDREAIDFDGLTLFRFNRARS